MVPHIQGLGESFNNICNKMNIQVYFKGGNTIKNLLVAPMDKDSITQKSGVIYRLSSTGWSVMRSTWGSLKGHLGKDSMNIIGLLSPFMAIPTSHIIKPSNPFLNRTIGKHQLSNIWDDILFNIPDINLK